MFLNKLIEIANNQEIKASAKSINQAQRNALATELTNALLQALTKDSENDNGVYTLNDFVSCGMIDNKTIEFAIDNEKVGIIPIRISVAFPNFDTDLDLYTRVEEYQNTLEEKALKEKEKAEQKALKIKADEERRAKQKALKEQAESENK
jgi:hypothetical protein